jgi:23S rRNA pseudouridine1911/1915/1917 synthase
MKRKKSVTPVPAARAQATGSRRTTKTTRSNPTHKQTPNAAAALRHYPVKEETELLAFLLTTLPGGRNAIKSVLARGQVSVDQKPTTAYNHPLRAGQTVSVSMGRIAEAPSFMGLRILHEDADLIVIDKEAGLLSVASGEEKEMTAYRQLMEHVRRESAENRIFVLHRLDRDTSGVMMFAKSEQVQQTLQNAWKEMVKERLYVALVEGRLRKPQGTISSWLKETSTLMMYSTPHPNGGQHAVTHYRLLEAGTHYSLLEIELETGRKNQIRVHMQDIGHPVAGDKKYGAVSKTVGRLGLHARVLAFLHPTTGELMRFETEIPKPFLNVLRTVQ